MSRSAKSRLILGLMSGTSHDGVDAAIAHIKGFGPRSAVKLLYSSHYSYSRKFKEKIWNAFQGRTEDICRLNFELGEVFAQAAIKAIKDSRIGPQAIASHGQTIYHIPPERNTPGSTLQIGEPSVIAERTGLPVVAGFRGADMAQGGHGAPLVPFADYVLFRGKEVKGIQNIGGIANVTVVTPRIKDVIAFDTGPGNSLVDECIRLLYGKRMDRDGRIGRSGKVSEALLRKLLGHSYFRKRPPKSTGRELFGKLFLCEAFRMLKGTGTPPEDIVCTLTVLTAFSIRDAYKKFILPRYPLKEIILTGGGARNRFLVGLLREAFRGIKISMIEEYGIPYHAKEALSFAILANETLSGRPSNIPKATGAKKDVVLGGIYRP